MTASRTTPHVFSVDVEEYFQVNAFDGVVSRERWDELPSRVEASVHTLLELLDGYDAKGTFFTLGWIADRHPHVVRAIADAGHEIASHGWWHRRVVTLTRDQFRDEVRDSRLLLEDVTGTPVVGYRAPSFSILPRVEWAYDVLLEEGYRYDSSVFPIRRRDYGNPHATPHAHVVRRPGGEILELPMATTRIAGVRVPGAGGAYLRLLPFWITRRTLRESARRGESAVLYVHPWEVDPEQPRLEVRRLVRLRHYSRLDRTLPRLRSLLDEFHFVSVAERYGEELRGPLARPEAAAPRGAGPGGAAGAEEAGAEAPAVHRTGAREATGTTDRRVPGTE